MNIENDKRWDVSKDIKKFGENIFNEEYIEKGDGLRKKLSDPTFIPDFRKRLKQKLEDATEIMKGFCDQFYGILDTNRLTTDNLANKKNGISSYFNKLGNGELRDEKVCNQTLEKCLNSSGSWVTKNAENRDSIISLVESELRPLLIDAEKMRPIQKTTINSCKLTLKYINNLRLLANIDMEVRELNQRNNRFLLSDTNALLHGLISKGDATFVYEKIGTNIDTVMIDEFQDTSRMQWENFHLLLEECLSQKEGSLIVGDIKQSIYRWRNGDWKILANIKHDPTLRVNECTLDTNWRSESMIIRFNNEFFTAACLELNNRYEEEMKEPCAPLVNAYIDVCQKTAKKTDNGYVKVSMLTDSKDNPFREQVLNELVDEVKSLIEQGVQINDIAILVRKNKDIPQIAEFFDKNAGVRIVSDEAFQLNASLAICMMIDGLRYLTTPEDTVAKARLALSYQKEILRQDIDMNTILLNGTDQYLPADFLLRQKELRFMPLYELLEKLFVIFSMNQIKQQDAYLCAFYDAITEYMQKNSSELTAFIAFWDEHLSTKTIPSGEIDGLTCTAEEDIELASATARKYGLQFNIIDLQKEYWDRVVAYAIDKVRRGLTPNPDVMCNKLIKFGCFEEQAGYAYDRIATGHYASTEDINGRTWLTTAIDPVKDQTDFLAQIDYFQVSKLLLPLGGIMKHDVREIALQAKLPSARRKDSQGICFLGKINYNDFIKRFLGEKRGSIIELETGKKIGTHNGFWFHTIGQRKGLGLGGGPWFVIRIAWL